MGIQTNFRNLIRNGNASGNTLYSRVGKIGLSTSRYLERVSGTAASRARSQAELVGKLARSPELTRSNKYLSKLAPILQRRADSLTAATKASRIRTGLAIGSVALAGKALSNLSNSTENPAQYPDYSNYYGNGL